MSLRYALLALLTAEPLTGYDAVKRFGGSVGYVWHAPDSQIYPELRRMEGEGLIEGEQVRWGPNSTKTRYSITGDGVRALREWLATPISYGPLRDVSRMRAAYFEWADPESARENLRRHIDYYTEQVGRWRDMREAILSASHPSIAARMEKYPAEDHERIVAYKAFAYEGLIARGEAEIEWGRKGLNLIDKLEGPSEAAGESER